MKRVTTYLLMLCWGLNCFSFGSSTLYTVRTPGSFCLAPFWGSGPQVLFDEDDDYDVIGGGDHSVVYSGVAFVRHPDGRREKTSVVIKDVVFLYQGSDAERLFDNETQMFRALGADPRLSEFVPVLYDYYKNKADNVGVIVMENLGAGDNPFKPFTRANLDLCRNLEEKLLVIREMCRVFEILNDEGYVHLDVEPDNIMFRINERPDGTRYAQVRLIDLEDIERKSDADSRAVIRQIASLGGCFAEFLSYVDFKWIDITALSQLQLPVYYGIDALITLMVLPAFQDGYTSFRNMKQVSVVWDNVINDFYDFYSDTAISHAA